MSLGMYKKEGIQAMNLAEEARKMCEDANVIKREQLILRLKDLKNIIEFYNGRLKKNNLDEYSISKLDNQNISFIINYALNNLDDSYPVVDKLKILKGLGQILLGYDILEKELKYNINNVPSQIYASQPETFARAFLMPKQLFVKEVAKHLQDDIVDTNDIAKLFETDRRSVALRGLELDMFSKEGANAYEFKIK